MSSNATTFWAIYAALVGTAICRSANPVDFKESATIGVMAAIGATFLEGYTSEIVNAVAAFAVVTAPVAAVSWLLSDPVKPSKTRQ